MAELTTETVREIVNEKFDRLMIKMDQQFDKHIESTKRLFNDAIIEINQRLAETNDQTVAGIQSVLSTVERLNDEDRDELAGVKGRLQNHNERIAKLERLNQLR